MPDILGIRLEFILFALTLVGVAVFHNKTFWVAITGLAVILTYKLVVDPAFHPGEHFLGQTPLLTQLMDKDLRQGEWPILLNLFGLLIGFALLSKTFEESGVPDVMPRWLPSDWKGPFVLLIFVCVLSSFLDNIAAALIGGSIALVVFNRKVHIGYIAAIVAASNAGGAGSVVGDTTTTMMWIDGVSPFNVLHAYVAALVAVVFLGLFAARQQHKHQPIQRGEHEDARIDWRKLAIVLIILVGAILGNVYYDMPALGVWVAIVVGQFLRPMPWGEVKGAVLGTIFLLSLVTCASMMPVEELPPASWVTAFILGFVSAVFDNIPLTKLCLDQGCFDWGMLAYTVGFGGSMIWFGSSAGVAITNKFPEGRNVLLWLRHGWHVTVGYVLGFFVLLGLLGWEPADTREIKLDQCPQTEAAAPAPAPSAPAN